VDAADRHLVLDDSGTLAYDYLLLASVATKDYDAIPGFRDFGTPCATTPRRHDWSRPWTGSPVARWSSARPGGRGEPECRCPSWPLPARGRSPRSCSGWRTTNYAVVACVIAVRSRCSAPDTSSSRTLAPRCTPPWSPPFARADTEVTTGKVLSGLTNGAVQFDDGTRWDSALSIMLPPYTGNAVVKRSPGLDDKRGSSRRTRRCGTSTSTGCTGTGTQPPPS